MQIETRPFAPINGVHFGSDVDSLRYLDGNLNVILACSQDEKELFTDSKFISYNHQAFVFWMSAT